MLAISTVAGVSTAHESCVKTIIVGAPTGAMSEGAPYLRIQGLV